MRAAARTTAFMMATALGFAGLAQAQDGMSVQYYALLDGSNAVPPVTTDATGEAEFEFDTGSMVLSWTLTYDGLSGPPTGAFVHGPAGAGERGPVVLILGRDLTVPVEGSATLSDAQAEQLADGQWYVNIRTAENPTGEIRGTVVPEVVEGAEPRADVGDLDESPAAEQPPAGDEPAIQNEPLVAEDAPMEDQQPMEPDQPMEGAAGEQEAMDADAPAEGAEAEGAEAAMMASYTEEQADRGRDAYRENCAGCHGRTLGGDAESPALAGSGFRDRWFVDQAAVGFFVYISNAMPQQAPGSLEPQTYADIMAYILEVNGFPGGETELPPDTEALAHLPIPERAE